MGLKAGGCSVKTIGLIGGLSWESSAEYYRIINEEVQRRLGGTHSAKCVMYSFDFAEIEQLQHEGRWEELARMMIESARSLKASGADFVVICSNTMHKMAEDIEREADIPLLHIADATALAIRKTGLEHVGLLGTRFTMEENFYKGRLTNHFDLAVRTPDADDRQAVHDIIYSELVQGEINPTSKETYQHIIRRLTETGSQGIILGCTEIGLLIKQGDVDVPVFDTTYLHAIAAVDRALS